MAGRPNVLVVGIDTLRADRLGCYGYQRPTTPAIDAIAAEAVLFERAISQAPWTLPAFGSMFTGLLPSVHGGGRGKGWKCDHMSPEHRTLAALLRRVGYRTSAFVTNGWVSNEVGFGQGIDPEDYTTWIESDGTYYAAMEWLYEHDDAPFFMFLHMVDPHAPYKPRDEDLRAVGVEPDPEAAARINDVVSNKRPREDLLPTDPAVLSDLYDGEVRRADERVGRLVAELRARNVLERTILVIVSDHGEELFEHDRVGHGHSLYDELLHVPFMVRFPNGRWAQRVSDQVRTMDLMPTILDAVGLPVPEGLDGQSLMPLIREDPGAVAPPLAPSEFLWDGQEMKSVRHPDAKMMLTPATGEVQWFDLVRDPDETAPIRSVVGRAVSLQQDVERVFATRLDGLLVTAFGDGAEHDLRLVITTESAFEEASVMGGERGDRFALSRDRRRLKARFQLAASSFPPGWVDIESLRLHAAGNAPIHIRGTINGRPLGPAMLRLGRSRRRVTGRPPWTIRQDDPRVVVPVGFRPSRDGNASVVVTAQGTVRTERAPLSDKTKESLRALGYIE